MFVNIGAALIKTKEEGLDTAKMEKILKENKIILE